ncbi:BolA family protein [Psychromonas antarctica]|jgi:acid stress-induced BolA-like protein IbaG/YrbA|uniref:BolA family protein n=1 Tax=Psychromonas antarctica TaxID=67573 RepID=UPI001EE838DB|nr:BolA/IbaG family iron-sulfur metabolism protein [Psychromonas antarctica]MCG6199735.1 BolA/IbaG family iron-sulfur metabolism protein [Psychromonas antarctica]
MNIDIIKEKLQQALVLDECIVRGESGSFQVIVVGDVFCGLSRVKKQQIIYAPLTEDIASNAIHALTIKALTPDEWQKQKHFI